MSGETCKRNFSKEQLLEGLRAGKLFYVDRRDAPELPELLEMEKEGLVWKRLVEFDEQSSALEFWWTGKAVPGTGTKAEAVVTEPINHAEKKD